MYLFIYSFIFKKLGLDLLRMCSIYTAQPIQDNNKDFVVELLKRNFPISPKEKDIESNKFIVNCRMFILRFISNLFASKIGKSFINENMKLVCNNYLYIHIYLFIIY